MELTLTRNKLIVIGLAALIVLAALATGGYFAWSGGFSALIHHNAPPANAPAFSAVNSMFSGASSESAWEEQVCAGMTADGCKLFENLYGPAIWSAISAGQMPKTAFTYASTVQTMSATEQVWKLSTNNPNQPWLYVDVSQDPATHQWMLVRILFDQEVQARYGK